MRANENFLIRSLKAKIDSIWLYIYIYNANVNNFIKTDQKFLITKEEGFVKLELNYVIKN